MSADRWIETLPEETRAAARELYTALLPDIALDGVLGTGGMGAVFAGREVSLDRAVAVKLLAPALANDAVALQRFIREAQTAAAIEHPHVIPVYRVGTLPGSGTPYFVMQRVDGASLDRLYPEGTRVAIAEVRRLVGQVASALAAAHGRDLVHRDIKPGNILVDRAGGRVIVADFGISASRDRVPLDQRLTQQGQALGTPRYMSPETCAGEAAVPASDVYALGCVAYELLTGHAVFEAATPMGVIARHVRDEPVSIASLRPDTPKDLSDLVTRMLAKDPAQRPTADAVARELLPDELPFDWPPPGLQRVHGLLLRMGRWMPVATALFGTPLCVALGLGVDVALLGSGGAAIIGILVLIPTLVFLVGTGIVFGVALDAIRLGRRNGIASFTVLEVMVDPGDTGLLIGGRRGYASLGPEARWRERQRRIWPSVLLASTGPMTLFAFVAGAILLPRVGGGPTGIAWLAIGALLVPAILAWGVAASRSGFRLERGRPKSRSLLITIVPSQARAWRAAVSASVGTSGLDADPVRSVAYWTASVLMGLSMIATAAIIVLLVILSVLQSISGNGRLEGAQRALAEAREWRAVPAALRPAIDSSLSPMEAGRLAYRLFRPSRTEQLRWLPPDTTPVSPTIGFSTDTTRRLFGDAATGSERWDVIIGQTARHSLSAEQTSWLARMAAVPGAEEFGRLSHARTMDLYGVLLGPSGRVTIALNQFVPTRVFQLADARMASATLLAAAGNRAAALERLREVLGVGALLMADGRRLRDFTFGTRLVRRAAGAMRLLVAIDRGDLGPVLALSLPTPAVLYAAVIDRDNRNSRREALAFIRSAAEDTSAFPAIRLAAIGSLLAQRCVGAFNSQFTRDDREDSAFASLARTLPRPSDQAIIAWARDTLASPTLVDPRAPGDSLPHAQASIRIVGRIITMLGATRQGASCLASLVDASFW